MYLFIYIYTYINTQTRPLPPHDVHPVLFLHTPSIYTKPPDNTLLCDGNGLGTGCPRGQNSFETEPCAHKPHKSSLLTPVAGLIFETKNRAIFLERIFGRGITAREQLSRAVILARF